MDGSSKKETDGLLLRVHEKYALLTKALIEKNISVAAMESCTSGLVASLITDTEGASAVFMGGLVTYSNMAKELFGVPAALIKKYGVYSPQTAGAMAESCRKLMGTRIGIGVTGSFGNPDPANPDSVPGSVDFAISTEEETALYRIKLGKADDRFMSKLYTAEKVCDVLNDMIKKRG